LIFSTTTRTTRYARMWNE